MTGFMLTAQKLKEKKRKCLIIMHESYPSFKTCSHTNYKLPHLFRYTEFPTKGISGAEIPTVHVDFGIIGLALGIY